MQGFRLLRFIKITLSRLRVTPESSLLPRILIPKQDQFRNTITFNGVSGVVPFMKYLGLSGFPDIIHNSSLRPLLFSLNLANYNGHYNLFS